ncbi:hypothetical protein A1O3_10277 [Capronia epimyces CBS 606.96]|uniref:C2H2-type domain-containing protein n=1 Tax=Capronia epimyces CBS 606.96 TaxID=1182542 RepID=W9Y3S2_9EURO|nr:uncharacterized protein A1O3_10277 [Capronia epimyces CBS 606.96]EXJ77119.1 hypothetical protein A1O3_10277 [Capronia epimyces CBS 606.96]
MAIIGTSTIVFPKLDLAKGESGKGKRTHVCNVCSRAFKRSEHCIRHQRGHTQEKPFACRVCRRRYSRRDLLVRHERTLHSPEQLANATEEPPPKKARSATQTSANEVPSANSSSEELSDEALILAETHQIQPPSDRDGEQTIISKQAATQPTVSSTTIQDAEPEGTGSSHEVFQQSSTVDLAMGSQISPPIVPDTAARMDLSATTMLEATDFGVVIPEIDRMRTFPTSMPLPELDGDLDFLNFFDPFTGLHPKQVEACALPPLIGNIDGWSPLENFSTSSQTSMQDYDFHQASVPTSTSSDPQLVDSSRLTSQPGNSPTSGLGQGWKPDCQKSKITSTSVLSGVGTYQSPELEKPVSDRQGSLTFTDEMRSTISEDLSRRLSPEQLHSFRLPSTTALRKCLRTYVDAFHVHMPIFHLHTMDLGSTPSPLVLVICAIGALYRLERKVAASLYLAAGQALCATVDRRGQAPKKPRFLEDWSQPSVEKPASYQQYVWPSQTRLLLAMFACFSGDPEVIAKSIVQLGEFLIDYRELALAAKPRKAGLESLSWEEWIERETVKRLLYGHIMFGNLVTMTYGIPPGYSIVSDGYLEMPCEQCLWDASTAEKWHELAAWTGKSSSMSLRDAVSSLMCANPSKGVPDECWAWSPFAVSVVINAVSIQIWHITQGSYSLGHFSGHGSSAEAQKPQLLVQTEAALSRCRALITQVRSDADYAWSEADGPLLFNCLALLRVSYCRTFAGIGGADSMILLKESRAELVASIEDFVAMPQDRSDRVTRAVSRAFEGLLIPYKSGTLLVKKTAALTWAIGHALAGWDAALLVTKWLYAIELETRGGSTGTVGEREAQTMQSIRELLTDLDDGAGDQASGCLAAKLARYWAGFYDDTWVWGLTPRMGWALRELATCYESSLPGV